MKRILSCAIALWLTGSLVAADANNWVKVTDGRGTSVLFPAKPKEFPLEPGGKRFVLERNEGKVALVFAYSDIVPNVDVANANSVTLTLDGVTDNLTRTLKGRVVATRDSRYLGFPMRSLDLDVGVLGAYRTKIILTPGRLFQITVLAPNNYHQTIEAKKFVQSFRLWNDRPADAGAGGRYSQSELELFQLFSGTYDLNGRRVSPRSMEQNLDKVIKMTGSTDPRVRELAEMACVQYRLSLLYQKNRTDTQKAIEKRVREQGPKFFLRLLVDSAQDALLPPSRQRNTQQQIQDAAKLIDGLMGQEPQMRANEGFALLYFGYALGNVQRDKLRSMADRTPVPGPARKIEVTVAMDTNRASFGSLTVANRSQVALHHCLVLTQLTPDLAKIGKNAATELLVNQLVLPPAGFQKTTVKGAQQAVVLRTMIASTPKGGVFYVPELPAGAKLLMPFFDAREFPITTGGNVSLWCDETTIDCQPVANWEEAKVAYRNLLKSPPRP